MQLDKVETIEKGFTIEQASEMLGCSKNTVRRKIKAGELTAVKRVGAYGEQFFIDESEINVATEIRDVIPVVRNVSLQDFSKALDRALDSALGKAIAPLQQQIDTLATDNKALAVQNKALMDELEAIKQTTTFNHSELQAIKLNMLEEQQRIEQNRQSRDVELMQNIRLIQENQEHQKKSWWQKLRGK